MPEVIRDGSLLKSHLKDVFLLGIPVIGCLSLAFWSREPWAFWTGIGAGAPLVLVCLWRQDRRFRTFRRPDCGVIRDPGFTESGD